jgi:hypothetical protein
MPEKSQPSIAQENPEEKGSKSSIIPLAQPMSDNFQKNWSEIFCLKDSNWNISTPSFAPNSLNFPNSGKQANENKKKKVYPS